MWISLILLTICGSKQVLKPLVLGLGAGTKPDTEKYSTDHYY